MAAATPVWHTLSGRTGWRKKKKGGRSNCIRPNASPSGGKEGDAYAAERSADPSPLIAGRKGKRPAEHLVTQTLFRSLNLACGLGLPDLNDTGFHPLRDVSLQINVKQTVFQVGAFYFNVVSKLEPALERATCNSAM